MELGIANGGLVIDEEPIPSAHDISLDSKIPIEEVINGKKRTTSESEALESLENAVLDEETNQTCLFIGNALEKFWKFLGDFAQERKLLVRGLVYVLLAVLYNAYFIASIYRSVDMGIPMDWCNGVGLLIIMTIFVYFGLFYFQVVKRFWGKPINRVVLQPLGKSFDRMWKHRYY